MVAQEEPQPEPQDAPTSITGDSNFTSDITGELGFGDSINSDDDISEAGTIHEETMSPDSIFDSPGGLTIHEPSELEEQPPQEKRREQAEELGVMDH